MSFDYNSSGLRTQKTVNGETKQYFYSGDLLVSEYDGVEYINFAYSPSGEPVGFSFLDAEENEILDYYIYLKNIQGDIIGLIDFKGEIHCTYSYDAWGKFLGAYDKNGNEITNPNSVALSNPLRYRGYYYDDESGLYYLNSRYYNPEWGMFISADAFADTQQNVIGTNAYAYCGNNPTCRSDSYGNVWITTIGIMAVGGLVGGITSAVSTACIDKAFDGSVNWKSVAISAASGFIDGAISASPLGPGVKIALGVAVDVVAYSVETDNFDWNEMAITVGSSLIFDSIGSKKLSFYDEFNDALSFSRKKIEREARRQNQSYAQKAVASVKSYTAERITSIITKETIKSAATSTVTNVTFKIVRRFELPEPSFYGW